MSELLNEFQDASGLVTVGVFRTRSPGRQQHFHDLGADVPSDMVVVGGGAKACWTGVGALLTASYPNGQLTAWLGSSKDHLEAEAHMLEVYALGLRIKGMSRSQLIDQIHIATKDSGRGAHPSVSATLPSDFLLVGGGAKVEWTGEGSLLTASYPETSQSWMARAKDHGKSSPANLRVFGIGLRRHLPVGEVLQRITTAESSVASHPATVADIPHGFAMTSGGAEVHWRGQGNLLYRLEPEVSTTDQSFAVAAKDHVYADPSTLTAYGLGIRIQPRR